MNVPELDPVAHAHSDEITEEEAALVTGGADVRFRPQIRTIPLLPSDRRAIRIVEC